MDIILKIKGLLKERNISYIAFGKAIDKSKPTIDNYFNGRSKIDVETIQKIASVLNVPVSYFFGEDLNAVSGVKINDGSVHHFKPDETERLKTENENLKREIEYLKGNVADKEKLIKLLEKG